MLPLSLAGQTALITGGSRGIGAATVRMFVKAGANVVFNYQHAQAAAARVVSDAGEDRCHAIQADLSTVETAALLVERAVVRLGRIDLLVVNHGIWRPEETPIDALPDSQWRQTLGVDLDSVFGLVKYSVRQMKRQAPHHGSHARGRIVLVSSTAAQRGEAFHCDYAAAKGAIVSMTKGLSTELAPAGIYVNCVAPGWVCTDMSQTTLEDPAIAPDILARIPLGRVGTPDEIAAPILFLCTEHANFITGEVLNVNGGAVLAG